MRKKYSDIVKTLCPPAARKLGRESLPRHKGRRPYDYGATASRSMNVFNDKMRGLSRAASSLGGTAQFQRSVVLRGLGFHFRLHRFDPAALDTRGLHARGDFGVRRADRSGMLRRAQRARTRDGTSHQHLVAPLVVEGAIGEGHARHRGAEAAIVG